MILSIIIPVYNVEKYVAKCIKSCQSQDIPQDSYEIIIINDGSTDNSLAIVEEIASEYENIKIISQPNGGLSAARNTGILNAVGEYFMFVDSDDWIEQNCLSRITNKLILERPDCLAICGANVIDGVPYRRRTHSDETPVIGVDYIREGFQDGAPFAIWSSAFFKKNSFSFKQGIFHEDSELTPRAYYLAQKVSRTNDIIYYVYQNPNSITRSVNYKRSFDLIEEVCLSLHNFYKEEVKESDRVLFDEKISILFNNAHYICRHAPKEIISKLNVAVAANNWILLHLRKSNRLKNRLQFILLSLFPNHSMEVYKFLSLFRI